MADAAPRTGNAEDGLPALVARLRSGLPGGAPGLIGLLVALLLLFSAAIPGFASLGTAQSFMVQLPVLGLLSLAMVVPLITGGLNLAIIATANQCALAMAWIMRTGLASDAGPGTTAAVILLALAAGLALALRLFLQRTNAARTRREGFEGNAGAAGALASGKLPPAALDGRSVAEAVTEVQLAPEDYEDVTDWKTVGFRYRL